VIKDGVALRLAISSSDTSELGEDGGVGVIISGITLRRHAVVTRTRLYLFQDFFGFSPSQQREQLSKIGIIRRL
jgi:hypothetical protein